MYYNNKSINYIVKSMNIYKTINKALLYGMDAVLNDKSRSGKPRIISYEAKHIL